jgi:hypothetical protein
VPISLPVVAALLSNKLGNMSKTRVKSQSNCSRLAHPFGVESCAYQFTQGWDSLLTCYPPHHQPLRAVWWEYPAVEMEDGDCSIPLELYLRALQHLGVSRKEIGDLIGGSY